MQKEIFLAGGCFWGTEHFFKQIKGVKETTVGYANGHTEHPSYEEVYTDTTGFAETVRVAYDPEEISLRFLLDMYWHAIDPTMINQQGHDIGTRYRTGIYYTDAADLLVIQASVEAEATKHDKPVVTEVLPLTNFYPAEERHQDYLDKNPDGYCHLPLELFRWAKKAGKQINGLTN